MVVENCSPNPYEQVVNEFKRVLLGCLGSKFAKEVGSNLVQAWA